ncbi:hypothetical protein BJY04DRAFT_216502 [Aspergillus karnatakaensis]|uniref:uncharacterized protein n=1 Tax=Aspergillus karnatakaensis TaxID=1810916 RepID=UPI003CCCFE5B
MPPRRGAHFRQKPQAATKDEKGDTEYVYDSSSSSSSSSSNNNNSRKRPAAADLHLAESRPLKYLVTEQDRAVQHWLDHGTMPGMPKINPFYALYCARSKPMRLVSTRSQSATQPNSPEPEPRERGWIAYNSKACAQYLKLNNCFIMFPSTEPSETSQADCKTLIMGKWGGNPPSRTIFDEDKIKRTLHRFASRPENAIIRAMGELIVPCLDHLDEINTLADSMDEAWDESIPLDEGVPPTQHDADLQGNVRYYLSIPQPGYSVGFSRSAFTKQELLKLKPFLGGINTTSFFRPTDTMHFPFLVAEAKSNAAGLDVAEKQNMHSMALSLRGIVHLFRLVKREEELDRMILGFSIAHNSTNVWIYGYYPEITGPNRISYYDYEIASFQISSETRWKSYNFVMAIYHKWAPTHLKRIRSAIEQLPDNIRAAEPEQSQLAGDSSDSRDPAASAEWSSSHSGFR